MTAVAEREYAELLQERRPHSSRTKPQYARAMGEIEELTIRGEKRSVAETEYYRVLRALVADYERSIGADQWARLDPADAVRELMELKGVTQTQVASALGDRSAASLILNGRRQISKSQAKKLADLFHVDAGMFI
jgi:HTH-type transcriptional regulator / antitoxin HigA